MDMSTKKRTFFLRLSLVNPTFKRLTEMVNRRSNRQINGSIETNVDFHKICFDLLHIPKRKDLSFANILELK